MCGQITNGGTKAASKERVVGDGLREDDRQVKGPEVTRAADGRAAPCSGRKGLERTAGKVGRLGKNGLTFLAAGGGGRGGRLGSGGRRGRLEAVALGAPGVENLLPEGGHVRVK